MIKNNKEPGLQIRMRQVGPWGLNAYALVCYETRQSVLIDPGADPAIAGMILSGYSFANCRIMLLSNLVREERIVLVTPFLSMRRITSSIVVLDVIWLWASMK